QFTVELDNGNGDTNENFSTGDFFTLNGTGSVSGNLQLTAVFDNGQNLLTNLPNFVTADQPLFIFRQSTQSNSSVNQTRPEISVGGANQNVGVIDTDFGQFLPYADDPQGILSAILNLDL